MNLEMFLTVTDIHLFHGDQWQYRCSGNGGKPVGGRAQWIQHDNDVKWTISQGSLFSTHLLNRVSGLSHVVQWASQFGKYFCETYYVDNWQSLKASSIQFTHNTCVSNVDGIILNHIIITLISSYLCNGSSSLDVINAGAKTNATIGGKRPAMLCHQSTTIIFPLQLSVEVQM